MELSLQHIVYLLLVVCTGLSAGLCFTWFNSVTPGIGRLDDLDFLMSFQQMNRAILNPAFFAVFFGPFFLGLVNLFLFKNTSSSFWWWLLIAFLIYFVGVVLVTVLGNVPLNEILDKHNLKTLNEVKIKDLRNTFETKWNQLHFIRTITSILSFITLVILTTQITK
ncbi:MAG: DUF1772 domain-containing protein [Winogradskyella sp.]|uniref:anthrone oxygenase family protein n=1 Tax=Winogradskyella sp. TaxID=1883156 RepID=UPI000F3C0F65|nr:DUF1772 domain-containing protein [Winogradskyella sp.]RNC85004.1 MAG: DUF1772 domain-containing protein [Winogradskyella sp.]